MGKFIFLCSIFLLLHTIIQAHVSITGKFIPIILYPHSSSSWCKYYREVYSDTIWISCDFRGSLLSRTTLITHISNIISLGYYMYDVLLGRILVNVFKAYAKFHSKRKKPFQLKIFSFSHRVTLFCVTLESGTNSIKSHIFK